MNTRILIAAACLFPVVCNAESDTQLQPKGQRLLQKPVQKMDAAVERMPEEIKERFKAAQEAAMKNPKVQELRKKVEAAGKEFQAAMREEMQKVDPDLQESVRGVFKKEMKSKGGDSRIWSLPAGKKEQLETAREKAKNNPAVQAASEEMKSAQTPEERDAAREKFHKAMRVAVLEIDPSLEGALNKLKQSNKPSHGSGGEEKTPEMNE